MAPLRVTTLEEKSACDHAFRGTSVVFINKLSAYWKFVIHFDCLMSLYCTLRVGTVMFVLYFLSFLTQIV